jgi:hypothetical protein
MGWLASALEKLLIFIDHFVVFLTNNFWVIYGIGFVAILVITALTLLLVEDEEDGVLEICACGLVIAIFWPLIAFGLIMLGIVYSVLCLLGLVCYVIMGAVCAPFKTKQIIRHWKKWNSLDPKKKEQIGGSRKRVLHYLWAGEES